MNYIYVDNHSVVSLIFQKRVISCQNNKLDINHQGRRAHAPLEIWKCSYLVIGMEYKMQFYITTAFLD